MSVVARQSFKYSIIGYLGFLLGTISTIFIFPFNLEFYGKLRFVLSTAEILVPIIVFGISFSNVKFFIKTQKDGKHQNILSLSLVAIFINFLIFLLGFYLFSLVFPNFKNTELWRMKRLILPLVLVLAFSAIFNKYISNYKRIVVPNIFENLFPKLANLGAFCLFFFLGVSEKGAFALFFGFFVLSLFGYSVYANQLEKITPNFNTDYLKKDQLWKSILSYSFFGFLGNIGNYIAIRIDGFMIVEYLPNGFEENGIYSTLYALISLISIPQMGLYSISAPIINKSFAENNMEELDAFHKKTSLTLFFLGAVLFSCAVVGFPYLTFFIKNGAVFRESEPVIWILGAAILFDLATGFNGNIISLSKYYRFNILVMVFLSVLTITLNFYFLKNTDLGIIGIALATAISLTIYNIVKILFNYLKFKVYPLGIEMIYVTIICSLAIAISIVLPDFKSNFFNLIYKPFSVLLFIFVGNYFLKILAIEKYINKNFLKSIFKFK